ncbi:hypothetical protein COV06_03815 [Candidatus Uhrbacteria bacterium CG10_big_fil_rev_8_21_14_0_10_50_16]|uniref:Glycosyl transferase family 1 n=1 Tax=Candidatus Uhrbacteria bacterium CG10_big_fil_rev_8_21_14_0_10_50_16 TaxID=1975039 RepID=A0A2H0RLN7_9BACT|nr:MAG: hypothetical protein COV06_03815 [Candidatus Uhrbacteria bacterium CG10_big_fil_rev_8_21_14_0_10_50_16]
MRIAFLGQKSLILGRTAGGIETHVVNLATRLVLRGHEVTAYARKRYSTEHPTYYEGVRVHYLPTVYSKNLEAIIHTFLATVDVCLRPVDVIHYHGVGPALLSWIPRLLRPHVTVIATFHAQDRLHQKWGLFGRIALRAGEWMACRAPHATITVSHGLQVICRDRYHTEAVFIPSGADRQTIRKQHLLAAFGLKKDGYLLMVGRLLKVKGVHHLIQAFRRIKTDKHLVIVGAPALKDTYLEQLKALAEGDTRIQFIGFQTGETLAQLYAHAYLYCQPSESEGLPLTVLEAMAFGTAVLVSDIPGNLEAIHRAGFTFENKDVDDLEQQLRHLVENPEEIKRAQRDVKRVIEDYFAWDRIVDQTLEVYRSVRH